MSVGGVLAAARTMQGRSIDEVSSATRIRPHLIRAIEADDYAACGGDVYTRGHVRALARFLGVNADPLLAELASTGRARPAPVSVSAAEGGLVIRERRRAPGWTLAMAVALAVIAGLAALRLLIPAADHPAPSAARPAPQHRATPGAPKPSPSASVPPAGALAVSLTVTGSRCWISVTGSDGVSRLASVLTQGQTADFRDDSQLSIVLGNPGAVKVSVNGRRMKPAKETKGVQRFVVKASNPQAAFAGASPAASPAA